LEPTELYIETKKQQKRRKYENGFMNCSIIHSMYAIQYEIVLVWNEEDKKENEGDDQSFLLVLCLASVA
jgi:hypothetical protein